MKIQKIGFFPMYMLKTCFKHMKDFIGGEDLDLISYSFPEISLKIK